MSNRVGKQLNLILDGESLGEDILISELKLLFGWCEKEDMILMGFDRL